MLKSRPSWARGLKQGWRPRRQELKVAPFVGAWVETRAAFEETIKDSRALRGRVG